MKRITNHNPTIIMTKEEIKPMEEVVAPPKKKRGRPSKAELEARRLAEEAAAKAEAESPESAAGAEPAGIEAAVPEAAAEGSDPGEEVIIVPGKRRRRTKAEIMAAAALAAEALAKKKGESIALHATEQDMFASAAPQGDSEPQVSSFVPEEMFASGESNTDGEQMSLLERLQSKVKSAQVESLKQWEGDPGDGTDFIIMQDLPVEDNGAIPYTLSGFGLPFLHTAWVQRSHCRSSERRTKVN